MPVTVNKDVHGHNDAGKSLRTVQAFVGRPVSAQADTPDALEREIIALQTYLSTQNASTPSGKKFDPAKINKSIDNQMLSAKLVEVMAAANNT